MVKRVKSVWSLRHAGRDSGIQSRDVPGIAVPELRGSAVRTSTTVEQDRVASSRMKRRRAASKDLRANTARLHTQAGQRAAGPMRGSKRYRSPTSVSCCDASLPASAPRVTTLNGLAHLGWSALPIPKAGCAGYHFQLNNSEKSLSRPSVGSGDPTHRGFQDPQPIPSPRGHPAPMGLPAPSSDGRLVVSA